jgi:MFS family permease
MPCPLLIGKSPLPLSLSNRPIDASRINIGSAKVLGMSEDLNLGNGPRYSIVLLLFFPGYALSDIPSNWILTRVQPRIWLPFITFSWGAVLTGMAFVDDYQVMAFLRFLLGLAEGGVLPGIVFTIACWYTKTELHKRIAVAYGVGLVASALAGILSYGLGQLDGVRGMRGWRWIFSACIIVSDVKNWRADIESDRRSSDDGDRIDGAFLRAQVSRCDEVAHRRPASFPVPQARDRPWAL